MTSVHESTDTRIFLKECVSLAKSGYDTYLVAYGKSYIRNNVRVIGVGRKEDNRIKRILKGARRIYEEALKIDADIYHFHDPELLPYGKKLKDKGKVVIYDSHEDVPRQILAKTWIFLPFRKLVSIVYERYEKTVAVKLDCVITATPHIKEIFKKAGINAYDVKNYPVLDDICGKNEDYDSRDNYACYAGGLTEARGIMSMIRAIDQCQGKLLLAGILDEEYKEKLKKLPGYAKTEFLGFLDREDIEAVYNKSRVGLAVLKRTPNHVNSLAIKLFEYMAAGIPVVCSNFPLWIEIIEKKGCGICVEPENIEEIENAIQYIFDHPQKAKEMGNKGKHLVKERYNWSVEEKKLLRIYENCKGDVYNGVRGM